MIDKFWKHLQKTVSPRYPHSWNAYLYDVSTDVIAEVSNLCTVVVVLQPKHVLRDLLKLLRIAQVRQGVDEALYMVLDKVECCLLYTSPSPRD